jgi:adenylate cyclase class 2
MNQHENEIEAKFYVHSLAAVEERLKAAGAVLEQPRVFERNLRFDDRQGTLSQSGCVLRLRQDQASWLTYKGPSQPGQDVAVRREIEFNVGDATAAQAFLEAMGYHVIVTYEKFRTTYALGEAEVVLDEMPFGNFVEIEADSPEKVQVTADLLRLDWNARCAASYLELFRRLKLAWQLDMDDLIFEHFAGLRFSAADFDLQPADAGWDA